MPRVEAETNLHIDEKPLYFVRESSYALAVGDPISIKYPGREPQRYQAFKTKTEERVLGKLYEGEQFEVGEWAIATRLITSLPGQEPSITYVLNKPSDFQPKK